MIIFKSCRRCNGDLHLRRDTYGPHLTCLQCGFVRDFPVHSQSESDAAASIPLQDDQRVLVSSQAGGV